MTLGTSCNLLSLSWLSYKWVAGICVLEGMLGLNRSALTSDPKGKSAEVLFSVSARDKPGCLWSKMKGIDSEAHGEQRNRSARKQRKKETCCNPDLVCFTKTVYHKQPDALRDVSLGTGDWCHPTGLVSTRKACP